MKPQMRAALFTLLLASAVRGEANENCVECNRPKPGQPVPVSVQVPKAVETLLQNMCEERSNPASQAAALKKLAEENPDPAQTPKGFYLKPVSRTSTSVTYRLDDPASGKRGVPLMPGQALYLAIPPDLQGRPVRFVTLGHRQDPSDKRKQGWVDGEHDNHPTYTSVRLHSATATSEVDAWRYWNGDASGPAGAKFPEIGESAEIEGLYEWRKNGHRGAQTQAGSHDALYADAIELVAESRPGETMKNPVIISELTLKTLPPKADFFLGDEQAPDGTMAFSKGTKMGDIGTEEGRKYGGGQHSQGKFPGALVLNGYGQEEPKLPAGWKHEGDELVIPVPEGKILTGVELAAGDSHPDGVRNSDGGWGTQGWAKLDIGIEDGATGKIDWFDSNENVPPEGVLMGAPTDCGRVTKPGDKIHIRGRSDALYVMGVRVGMRNVE